MINYKVTYSFHLIL